MVCKTKYHCPNIIQFLEIKILVTNHKEPTRSAMWRPGITSIFCAHLTAGSSKLS